MPPALLAPSFGLSRWDAPGADELASYQARIAAAGAAVDRRAANAAADAWERAVLGPRAGAVAVVRDLDFGVSSCELSELSR